MNVRRVYNRVYIKRIPNEARMYRRVELNGPGGDSHMKGAGCSLEIWN